MLVIALVQVSGCVPDIICVAQITLKFIDHALIVYKLRTTFLNLDYPGHLINSSINEFLHNIDNISAPDEASHGTSNIVVPLPFKDQKSANSVKREMQNLSAKIGVQIKPVLQSKKISQVLSPKEKKSPVVNNQCVVYKVQCDLCDKDYVRYIYSIKSRIGNMFLTKKVNNI